MKLFVVLALLGLCSKAYGRDFCAGTGGRKVAEGLMDVLDIYLPDIIKEETCASAAALIESGHFWHEKCDEAFIQGYCFGTKVYEKHGPNEGETCIEDSKKIDTYIKMAKFATNYVGPIGEHGCNWALPCFKNVTGIIEQCTKENPMFFEMVVDNAFAVLSSFTEEFEGLMKVAEDVINCDFGDDADAQCLIAYAKTKAETLTVDGLKDTIKTFIASAKTEDIILNDLRSGLESFMEQSTKFCKAGCVSKSTTFFTHMFVGTDCKKSCPSIETYCGGCETNANNFLDWYPKTTPCCTQTALDNIMNAFNYLEDTFRSRILKLEEEEKNILRGECPGAVTRYEAYGTYATKQAQCVKSTYEKIESGCCSKCHPKCKNQSMKA